MIKEEVIEGTTCFNEHKKRSISCLKKDCRYWMNSDNNLNCSILASHEGEHTLQQIGDIFDVTRMRICQIEKSILASLSGLQNMKID